MIYAFEYVGKYLYLNFCKVGPFFKKYIFRIIIYK